jgi:hypothetical protein
LNASVAVTEVSSQTEGISYSVDDKLRILAAAKQFWGLLTRTAAKIAAATFATLWPLDLIPT